MVVGEYFTDDELESQLRWQFDYEEMWDVDFRIVFSQIVDRGDDFFLEFRNRQFSINKITGEVTEVQ